MRKSVSTLFFITVSQKKKSRPLDLLDTVVKDFSRCVFKDQYVLNQCVIESINHF